MNRKILLILMIFAAILLTAFATYQNYDMHWWSTDGGGGTSSADGYVVSGTIGQPDAGQAMSGGSYSLAGGYWQAGLAASLVESPIVLIPLLMR